MGRCMAVKVGRMAVKVDTGPQPVAFRGMALVLFRGPVEIHQAASLSFCVCFLGPECVSFTAGDEKREGKGNSAKVYSNR
jgi:hypothetical protein